MKVSLSGVTIALWLILMALSLSLHAQVSVIRKLPETGGNKASATWKEPYPDPGRAVSVGEPELSGRLSVGGSAVAKPEGDRLYALTSDSAVTLVQPLGSAGSLSVDAAVLRSRSPTEQSRSYELTTGLILERLQFELNGGYGDSLKPIEGVDSEQAETTVGAALSSGMLETLPMSLSYESLWLEQQQDSVTEASSRSDELAFETAGTVGRVGVELGATLEYEENWEEKTESLGTGSDIVVSVPVANTVAVQALTVPNYNRSESELSTLESRSIEWGGGLLWSPREELNSRITGSRVDAWTEGSGVSYESRQVTYKATTDLSYEPPQGLFTAPSYAISKTEKGNLSQDLELRSGWRSEEAVVREAAGTGSAGLTRSDNGARIADALGWGADLLMKPISDMHLSSSYVGRYEWDAGAESWSNSLETGFGHTPFSSIEYRATVSLLDSHAEDEEDIFKHQYHGGITLEPQRRFRSYRTDLSETVVVNSGAVRNDVLSTAAIDSAVPLGENVTSQYGAEWEWINRTAPQKDPGNQFGYSAGLSLSGPPFPFSFNTRYAFSHGYRGVRHDVNSSATVPLGEGFAMEGLFTLSSYEEEEESRLPFLLELTLIREL